MEDTDFRAQLGVSSLLRMDSNRKDATGSRRNCWRVWFVEIVLRPDTLFPVYLDEYTRLVVAVSQERFGLIHVDGSNSR